MPSGINVPNGSAGVTELGTNIGFNGFEAPQASPGLDGSHDKYYMERNLGESNVSDVDIFQGLKSNILETLPLGYSGIPQGLGDIDLTNNVQNLCASFNGLNTAKWNFLDNLYMPPFDSLLHSTHMPNFELPDIGVSTESNHSRMSEQQLDTNGVEDGPNRCGPESEAGTIDFDINSWDFLEGIIANLASVPVPTATEPAGALPCI